MPNKLHCWNREATERTYKNKRLAGKGKVCAKCVFETENICSRTRVSSFCYSCFCPHYLISVATNGSAVWWCHNQCRLRCATCAYQSHRRFVSQAITDGEGTSACWLLKTFVVKLSLLRPAHVEIALCLSLLCARTLLQYFVLHLALLVAYLNFGNGQQILPV